MAGDFVIVDGPVRGRVTTLRVSGRLDARSVPLLLQRCAEVRSCGNHLVLSLEGVSFIASSGVGALLGLSEESRQGEHQVRFACLSSAVASVIELLNLDQFLSIDRTEEDALDALAA